MPIHAAIALAVAATVLINLGFVLQKRGATLAAQTAAAGQSGALVRVRVWRVGIVVMSIGWALYFVAAKFAPISIVQPALGAGMAVLALFSVFYLHERISGLEWSAFAAMLLGVVLLGLSAEAEDRAVLPAAAPLFGLTAGVIVVALGLFWLGRRERPFIRPDVVFGVLAGLLIGLGSLSIKAMFNYLDETSLAAGLTELERAAALDQRRLVGFGLCLPLVIAGNVLGIAVIQLGFRRGKALVVTPVQQVTNKAVAIAGGMAALSETLPADPVKTAARIVALALILMATAALARFGGEAGAEKK